MGFRHPARRASHLAARTLVHSEELESRTLFSVTTNDPMLGSQYALTNTAVKDAWSVTVGKRSTVVADIDSGADYKHQDLYKNIWINQAEIPANYKAELKDVDGDGRITFNDLNSSTDRPFMHDVNGNGYIDGGDLLASTSAGGWADGINGKSNANDVYTDDIIGWDFAENDNNPYDDGTTNIGHGTHTAGIIGAVGNNGVGISGVAQKVSLMLVRIFNDNGTSAANSQVAAAIRYTADNGARAANASWGGTGGFNGDTIYNAIAYAGSKNEVFVTAAGNSGLNIDSMSNNFYPAEYSLSNIIAVGADTSSGTLASYSNYGANQVDVVAPGSSVLSTLPGNKYGYLSGTSMATPMVTGAVAPMVSANSSLTVSTIKSRLINGADESTALKDKSVSDGELNVNNAVHGTSGINLTSTNSLAGTTQNTTTTTTSTASTLLDLTRHA